MPDIPDSINKQLVCKPLEGISAKDLLFLHEADPQRYPALLETSQQASDADAFDILFALPQEHIKYQQSTLSYSENLSPLDHEKASGFLSALDEQWSQCSIQASHPTDSFSFLPFQGGWFVYMGYELVGEIEPVLKNIPIPDEPVAYALRIPSAIIYSHRRQTYYLVTEAEYAHHIEILEQDFKNLKSSVSKEKHIAQESVKLNEEDANTYLEGITKIKRYIYDGDIFQANLSRAWTAQVSNHYSPVLLYKQLRYTNPSPFAGIARFEGHSIISSSPERLLQVKDQHIQTRPIAGTYPRSKQASKDQQYSSELVLNPKECAEHIMLVDLERNDLGRLCQYGSIEVDEMMVVESYRHVHHIVSNVKGKLRADTTPGQIISALFPGGTITGCPKVRCMEILLELENSARGAYTGSMGYLNHSGEMDLNILIRTIVHYKNRVTIRAGAGIVADSDPQRELEETRSKAKGMIKALQGE